ncbi:MAG: ribosomal protein S18-alanine N-acetyltransferase [Oscillospiraceae bacterium]|nr:ribosomal protein S18-alanine N-acetyltransferase [Oscillospiraceae bacterium]
MIIPMELCHIDRIAVLEVECFALPFSKPLLLQELENPNALYLVDCLDDIIRGYVGLNFVLDEGHITTLTTAPLFRRQGIASRLLKRQIILAKTLGLQQLHLEVRDSNIAARKLYLRHDFAEVGRRAGYYTEPKEDAVLMTLELHDDNTGL